MSRNDARRLPENGYKELALSDTLNTRRNYKSSCIEEKKASVARYVRPKGRLTDKSFVKATKTEMQGIFS